VRLKLGWILLLLILEVHSAYCQYPRSKKIGNDSVIIITIDQANNINNLYKNYNDSIVKLNDSIINSNLNYAKLNKKIFEKTDSIYLWKVRYEAARELTNYRTQDHEKTDQAKEIGKYLLILIIILQFIKL
jgi:hypothetical protein